MLTMMLFHCNRLHDAGIDAVCAYRSTKARVVAPLSIKRLSHSGRIMSAAEVALGCASLD